MPTITLQGKEWTLSWIAKEFLENYLYRTKSFIINNWLEIELYVDIEQDIAERLSKLETISDKDIISIINDIGEAKDIFAGIIQKEKPKKVFFRKNGVFFGVAQWLGDYFNIGAFWFRILFIITAFFGGVGIIAYLAFVLLTPADKNPTLTLSTPVSQTQNILVRFFTFIWTCIKVVVFLLLGGFLCFVWLPFLIVGSVSFGHIIVDNQVLFGSVAVPLGMALVAFGAVICLFGIWLWTLTVNKKLFNWFIFSLLVIILIWSIGLWWYWVSQTIWKYTEHSTNTVSLTGTIENLGSWNISLIFTEASPTNLSRMLPVNVLFLPSTTDEIKIEVNRDVYGWSKDLANLLSIESLEVTTGNVSISLFDTDTFKQEVPFSFVKKDLRIYLPVDQKYQIQWAQNAELYFQNLSYSWSASPYRSRYACQHNWQIIYDVKLWSFVCLIPELPNNWHYEEF